MPEQVQLDSQTTQLFKSMEQSLQALARGAVGGGEGSAGSRRSAGGRAGAIEEKAGDDYERELARNAKSLSKQSALIGNMMKATRAATEATEANAASGIATRKNLDAFNDALAKSSNYLEHAQTEFNRLSGKTIPEQIAGLELLTKGSTQLTSKFAKAHQNASLLSASLLKSHTEIDDNSLQYGVYIDNLTESAEKLNNKMFSGMLKKTKLLDTETNKIIETAGAINFSDLRLALGQSETIIAEGLNSLGFKDIHEVMAQNIDDLLGKIDVEGEAGGDALRDTLVGIAAQLEKAGVDLGISVLDAEGKLDPAKVAAIQSYKDLAVAIQNQSAATRSVMGEFDELAETSNTLIGGLKQTYLTTKGASAKMAEWTGKLATTSVILGNLKVAASGVKQVFSEIEKFNVAQIPASYLEVKKAAMGLGMSFEEASAYFQDNKRLVALTGAESFKQMNNKLEGTFTQFGYNMKQAGEIVAPSIEAASAIGLNIRDGDKMNDYVKQTMTSFQNISGVVKESAADYVRLNAELYQSADVQGALVGLDQQQAVTYAKSLEQQRNALVTGGLSLQQAQEIVKAQQAAKREKVASRFTGAAMMGLQAQTVGMAPEDIQRAMKVQQQGRAATLEDQEWFNNTFVKQFAAAKEKKQAANDFTGGFGGVATETFFQQTDDQLGAIKQVLDSGTAQVAAQKSGKAATDAEMAASGQKTKGDSTVAAVGQTVNQASSIVSNTFLPAIGASAAGLFGLAFQSGKLALVFNQLATRGLGSILPGGGAPGASTVPGGAAGKGTGLLGKAGSMLGKGAGLLGKLAAPLAVLGAGVEGYSAWQGANAQVASGEITEKEATAKKTGAVVGTAGALAGALAGAKVGALGGAFLGPIGAAVGGLLGAAIGGIGGQWLASKGGEVAANAIQGEDKPEVKPANKKSGVERAADALSPAMMPGNTFTFYISGMSADANVIFTEPIKVTPVNTLGSTFSADRFPSISKEVTEANRDRAVTRPTLTYDDSFKLQSAMMQGKSGSQSVDNILNQARWAQVEMAPFVPTSVSQPDKTAPADSVNKKSKQQVDQGANLSIDTGGMMNVSDQSAQEKLAMIAASLTEAVNLLQKMTHNTDNLEDLTKAFSANELKSTAVRHIPTQYQYVTGRA